jgi:disulfide bond formation protein DsbB
MTLTPAQAAAVLLIASAALLVGALGFQYIGGLAPCVLCMWQRYAHGVTIALAGAALAAARRNPGRPQIAWALVAATGVALLAGAAIAAFHVGVEQHWWQGTAECGSSTGGAGNIEELRARLLNQPIVRCDEIAWSLFGISMAGYNFIASLVLAKFAGWQAWRNLRPSGTA